MVPTADVLGLPRRQLLILVGLAVGTLLWHLLLPSFFYRNVAIFIEGPLPALVGVGCGLWLFRAEDLPMQILGACACAFLASLAATVVFGLGVFGVLPMLGGVGTLLLLAFRLPFSGLGAAWGSGYFLYVLWIGVKILLVWGAIAFVVLLTRRHGTGWLGRLSRGIGDRRLVSRDMAKRNREYRALYAQAVRAGETPPAPPPQLAHGGRDVGSYARLSFWVLRIGLLIAGAIGLYATLGDQLSNMLGVVFWRGLVGG